MRRTFAWLGRVWPRPISGETSTRREKRTLPSRVALRQTSAPVEWASAKCGRRTVGQRHVLHEGLEIALVFLEAVDMALHAVAQPPFGAALPAPVEGGDGKAAAAQFADRLEILLDCSRRGPASGRPCRATCAPPAASGHSAAARRRWSGCRRPWHRRGPDCRRFRRVPWAFGRFLPLWARPARQPVIRAETGSAQARAENAPAAPLAGDAAGVHRLPASEGGGIDTGPVAAIGGRCVCRGNRLPIELVRQYADAA